MYSLLDAVVLYVEVAVNWEGANMLALRVGSTSILTKNLPSNFAEFCGLYLYTRNAIPSIIFVGKLPEESSVMKLIPSSKLI